MMVISAYGDDVFGHMLIDILKQNSVNAKGCLSDQHTRTMLAFVTLKSNSEQEFMFLIEAELNPPRPHLPLWLTLMCRSCLEI
jgi:sugar/nucleoside kinase (ribokinase family)